MNSDLVWVALILVSGFVLWVILPLPLQHYRGKIRIAIEKKSGKFWFRETNVFESVLLLLMRDSSTLTRVTQKMCDMNAHIPVATLQSEDWRVNDFLALLGVQPSYWAEDATNLPVVLADCTSMRDNEGLAWKTTLKLRTEGIKYLRKALETYSTSSFFERAVVRSSR